MASAVDEVLPTSTVVVEPALCADAFVGVSIVVAFPVGFSVVLSSRPFASVVAVGHVSCSFSGGDDMGVRVAVVNS